MKTFLSLAVFLMTCAFSCPAQRIITSHRHLHDGDLLFVTVEQETPITEVTRQGTQLRIDHVGIYHLHDGKPMVIEANYAGVVETTLEQFTKSTGKILVGRVKPQPDILKTLHNAHQHLGKPYDFIYMPSSDAVYCSELVTLSYVDKKGKAVFGPVPMSFHNDKGEITAYWKDYYSRRGLDVPEGVGGSNPSELSRRKAVKIKYILSQFAK